MSEVSKDEFIAINLALGNISVDFETGKVYRHRGQGGVRLATPKEMLGSDLKGYKVVSIRLDGEKMQCRIHRIVWIAANGIIPEGLVIDHINNNKSDNRLSNLQLVTHEQNSHLAKKEGLYLSGTNHPRAKINPEIAKQICDDYKHGGIAMWQLGERYGISRSRVQQIVTDRNWLDIEGASDSAKYKAVGNSVANPCSDFIFGRMVDVDRGIERR